MRTLGIICLLLSLSGCSSLLFYPERGLPFTPERAKLEYRDVTLTTADGLKLHGWWLPVKQGVEVKGTVLHLHGNGGNLAWHLGGSWWLPEQGYQVLMVDYRGYGRSEGEPSVPAIYQDIDAAFKWLDQAPEVQGKPLVLLGQSLGGALAVAALGESGFKPAAVVLEGTFYSYRQVAAAGLRSHWLTWPASWLPYLLVSGRHSPSDHIAGLTCPKVFLHAAGDGTVPFSQGRRLYDAAPGPKEFWEVPAGHIEAFTAFRAAYAPRLLAFLDAALAR